MKNEMSGNTSVFFELINENEMNSNTSIFFITKFWEEYNFTQIEK